MCMWANELSDAQCLCDLNASKLKLEVQFSSYGISSTITFSIFRKWTTAFCKILCANEKFSMFF